jgi:heme exporter protein A
VAQNLACLRGERLVFRGLSLAVRPGGALLLLGPNGAGKSTLLRVLAGLLRPDAGSVQWNGAEAGGRVAFVGHLDAVKPGLTAWENLALYARVGGGDRRAALAAMGLESLAELPARMLSAGQRRRLALARLVVSGAPVWLLDEPTLGLDTASVARLGDALARHRADGGAVVAATHLDLPLPHAESLRL